MSDQPHTGPAPGPEASCYGNRELSWLQFNRRVLEEAEDPANPLCERLNFASIFQSNLDEFYMVRVGMLMDTSHLSAADDKTGRTPAQQTAAVLAKTRELLAHRDRVCAGLMEELAAQGVELCRFDRLQDKAQSFLEKHFTSSVLPLLSPQIIGRKQPFPFLRNKAIYAVASLKTKNGGERMGIVPCGEGVLRRLVPLPGEGRRFVLVEDLDPGLLSAGGLEKLRQLAEELPEETLLVMTMGSVLPDLKKKGSKGAQVFQLCERLGGVCHFPKPAGPAAVQRMVSAAEKAGSSISKDAAQLLAEYCGREPQRMLTEVQKLAAHSPEGITPEDVRSLVAPVTEARVFDLPDKIIARNFTAAMAAINDLVFLRESPVSILSILSMAFVDLYRAGVARKAGIPDAEAKKALGYGGSGYRYDKGAQNQRKFSIPTLERILELLAEADKQMKTTGPDARVVLETTVAEIFREMEGA